MNIQDNQDLNQMPNNENMPNNNGDIQKEIPNSDNQKQRQDGFTTRKSKTTTDTSSNSNKS